GENYEKQRGWTLNETGGGKKVCFCLPKERTSRFAQRLQDRIRTTVQNGTSSLESCLRECEVCE
ncbi:hypothetical protein GWI33_008671, partial [Rhynchophorus ferrugineus]